MSPVSQLVEIPRGKLRWKLLSYLQKELLLIFWNLIQKNLEDILLSYLIICELLKGDISVPFFKNDIRDVGSTADFADFADFTVFLFDILDLLELLL